MSRFRILTAYIRFQILIVSVDLRKKEFKNRAKETEKNVKSKKRPFIISSFSYRKQGL